MAAAADADLMGIGRHCAVEHCAMLDFLPFKCDCCQQTYCLEHRTYAAHNCKQAHGKALEVIVCPLCAKGIHLRPDDNPNIVFERHSRGECDPSNYSKVHRKPKCPVQGCKEKLTTVNTYTCKTCTQRVCLKHRFEMDHKCPGPPLTAAAAARQSAASGAAAAAAAMAAAAAAGRSLSSRATALLSHSLTSWPHTPSTQPAAAAAPTGGRPIARQQQRQQQQQQQQPPPPAHASPTLRGGVIDVTGSGNHPSDNNSVRGTAARRRQMLGLSSPAAAAAAAGAGAAGGLSDEQCPQCGAHFSGLPELIAHVETQHGRGSTQQQQQQEQYACPGCNAVFEDAVMLVAHNQQCSRAAANRQQQQQGQQGQCVLC